MKISRRDVLAGGTTAAAMAIAGSGSGLPQTVTMPQKLGHTAELFHKPDTAGRPGAALALSSCSDAPSARREHS
jgi:hypothetical protein